MWRNAEELAKEGTDSFYPQLVPSISAGNHFLPGFLLTHRMALDDNEDTYAHAEKCWKKNIKHVTQY